MTRPRPAASASFLAAAAASLWLSGIATTASAFSIPLPESLAPIQHVLSDPTSFQHAFEQFSSSAASTLVASSVPADIISAYKGQLATNPLETKMLTGATVALMGDAIAQSRDVDNPYDRRRAVSFMAFDACYRWFQHELYPLIVSHMQGQYLGGLIAAIPPLANAAKAAGEASGTDPTFIYSVTEQTLSSQLGIVPFIYYPVFYTITGFLQHLTPSQTVDRAKETFLPLMKRNLLFWIPVQFVQFGFVEESLQIPFITVCGLCWTIILSVMAGAVEKNDQATEESREMASHYCITGAEDGCEINPDDLFPHVLENEIRMDFESRLVIDGKASNGKEIGGAEEVTKEDKEVEELVEL